MKKLVVLWACWAAWWGKTRGGEGRFGDRDMLSSSVESRPLFGSFCSSITVNNFTPNSTCCFRPFRYPVLTECKNKPFLAE